MAFVFNQVLVYKQKVPSSSEAWVMLEETIVSQSPL